ncbi:MAG: Spy/CpxP family protein refolding chaperone [Pyrinomonadaceae bacterium]|nr:Spy/CpxP family protein refolding chaperone [Pyrinomonadaceae bacterium]
MRINKLKFLSLFFLLIGCFMTVKAQDEMPPDAPPANQQKRPRLLEQLDLTREQIQQIRQITRQNRPLMREANRRLREANRNLDLAVYSDTADETEIQKRVKEVRDAHAEFIKLRAQSEFAVRKVLNPEQLAKFREIRQQALAEKENLPRLRNNQWMNNQNRPAIKNRLRQNRPLN